MSDVVRGGDGNDSIHNADELDDLTAAGGPGTADKLFFAPLRGPVALTKDNADKRWILDNEPNLTMARMGEAIVAAWPK